MTSRMPPKLGILIGDSPSANMIVVAYTSEATSRWAYVSPGAGMLRSHSFPLFSPQDFTPLSSFGVHATMNPDGLLCVHQIGISIATYSDGKAREWQGAQAAKIQINPRSGGYVIEAVRADFEARRARAS